MSAAVSQPSSAERQPKPKLNFDPRFAAPILITTILLVAQVGYGVLESFPKTLLAIVCSIATEVLAGLLVYRKVPHLASAYVSGISVGILIRSPLFWPYALCAMIAILSKYVLRVKGRHIWNPSNFAIATVIFLAPVTVSTLSIQWGNTLPPMLVVWALGAIIVSRLNRLHIVATYVASFIGFAALRAVLPGHHDFGFERAFLSEVAPITGPMYQLFIFFMITDPKTTVHTRKGQMAVAFTVAAAECALRLMNNVHAPYYALFLIGPTANLIEIDIDSRRPQSQKLSPAIT